ncbi:hypothetical protein [Pseudobdellovibrio sp. HCB154]|uniref:hypothetical protein n=1 Tax=Pseudobdellovibrio sp. HCB154 TaxID=3386277 RepID=UPI0039174EB7
MLKLFSAPLCALILVFGLSSCSDSDDDTALTGESSDLMVQQIGESMVSVDESSGNNNGTFTRSSFLEAACSGVSFGACGATVSATAVKDFNGCTIVNGLVTVSGTITLTYAGTGSGTCTIPAVGDSVAQVPAFTASLVGNNGSFAASALSTGQTLTRASSGTFTFANTGIRRVYTSGSGNAIADITTLTTSDITISGTTRTNRVINGGVLQVTNNLTNEVCNVSPNNVTWTSGSCSCPTSGTWTGTCSTGQPVSVAFTSTCGSVETMYGTASKTLTIERCN